MATVTGKCAGCCEAEAEKFAPLNIETSQLSLLVAVTNSFHLLSPVQSETKTERDIQQE
jgi:hypothetical protein